MTFTYTASNGRKSSAVDTVYYNSHNHQLAVALKSGDVYLYEKVPSSVYDGYLTAWSAGRYYAKNIKPVYGPGKHLGYNADDEFQRYSVPAPDMGAVNADSDDAGEAKGTPKGLTYAKDAVVDGKKVVSLATAAVSDSNTLRHTVYFRVGDSDEHKRYDVQARNVDEALRDLNDIASKLGVNLRATGVRVHFE
jgi:hypothetical protein